MKAHVMSWKQTKNEKKLYRNDVTCIKCNPGYETERGFYTTSKTPLFDVE